MIEVSYLYCYSALVMFSYWTCYSKTRMVYDKKQHTGSTVQQVPHTCNDLYCLTTMLHFHKLHSYIYSAPVFESFQTASVITLHHNSNHPRTNSCLSRNGSCTHQWITTRQQSNFYDYAFETKDILSNFHRTLIKLS